MHPVAGPYRVGEAVILDLRPHGARRLASASALAIDGRRFGVFVVRLSNPDGRSTQGTSACFND